MCPGGPVPGAGAADTGRRRVPAGGAHSQWRGQLGKAETAGQRAGRWARSLGPCPGGGGHRGSVSGADGAPAEWRAWGSRGGRREAGWAPRSRRGAPRPPPPVSPVPAAAEPVPQGPELPSFGVPCEGLPSSTQDSGRMGQAGLGGPPKRASTPWLWKLCLTYLDNESLHVYLVPRLWFWPHCLRSIHVISLDGFRVRLNPNTLAPLSPRSGGLAEPRTDDGHSVCVCGPFGNEHEPSEWRCGPCTSSVTCGPQGHGSHWGPATCAPHLALGVQEAKGRGVGGGAGLQGLLRM